MLARCDRSAASFRFGALWIAFSLAGSCRSLSERSFVTKCSSIEDYEQQQEDESDAAAANLIGQAVAYAFGGCAKKD